MLNGPIHRDKRAAGSVRGEAGWLCMLPMSRLADTTALILAGTRPGGDPFARENGVEHKGLIEVGDRTILERVVSALRKAGAGRIVLSTNCGAIEAMARDLGVDVIASQAGPSASVGAAFAEYGAPMLVTTSDHALLQPEWVGQFIADSPAEADLAVMLARREAVEQAVPGTQRTWMRFADGHWSGCNMFLLATPAASRALALWSEVEANRKKPWRIAARLGLGMLVGYAFGRLSLAAIVARLGARVGIDARIVAAEDGLAAVDVDKASDLALVRSLVKSRPELA